MRSAASIVATACREAKGPGYIAEGGNYLNDTLEDLKLNRNLKVNRVTSTININAATGYGPYALEPDYLRTYDLFYAIAPTGGGPQSQGQIILLNPITMEQMDSEIKNPQISNYPYEFATDVSTQAQVWSGGSQGQGTLLSAGQLFIYPATNGVVPLTHRYMKNQPDIVGPATSLQIPWFAFTAYLIKAVAAKVMGLTGDDRQAQYEAQAEKMLMPWLIMEGDEQQTVRNIRLDPRHFRTARGVRTTKMFPF